MLLYLFGLISEKKVKQNTKLHSKRVNFYYQLKGRSYSFRTKEGHKSSHKPGLISGFKHEWLANESAFLIDESAEKVVDEFFDAHKDLLTTSRKFYVKD